MGILSEREKRGRMLSRGISPSRKEEGENNLLSPDVSVVQTTAVRDEKKNPFGY